MEFQDRLENVINIDTGRVSEYVCEWASRQAGKCRVAGWRLDR